MAMLALAVLCAWFAFWCGRVFMASRVDSARFANIPKAQSQASSYGIAVGMVGLAAGLGSIAFVAGAVAVLVWKDEHGER
jgi:hypothetical protein